MFNKLLQIKNRFDFITSNHGKNWLLCLTWFFVFEFTSAVLEFYYIDESKYFIDVMPNGIYKEILISLLVVLLVWFTVFNIIFMKIEQFIMLSLYTFFCLYLFITNDITLNFFFHNINIFELNLDGFSFYSMIQIFLKIVVFYLFYKTFISFRNRNKLE